MRLSSAGGLNQQPTEGEKGCLNSELWHACAGPLVCLPAIGSHVVYFPQGHSEQVAASTNKVIDAHIPNHQNLPPQLICQLHNITMNAELDTDEVYAQMTLQPLSQQEQKEVSFIPADLGCSSKQPTNYFCKILTASDTSTHGGFSVPRRAAEKVFPPLDFSQQPPAQELIARDLHDSEWKFKHIFRGQPKRHLLTTGWSVFVSAKRLVAGDSVIFIWNEKNQLFLGIRRAIRPQTVMPSAVISSDSMHLGLLAAAAHAAATKSRFTVFYNPRASPSEFVIPLAKYVKSVHHTRVSVGMRFRMLFETEESSVRRYMGTITGIGDLDSARWPNSHWRSVKVGWDESTAGDKQPRVSLWEIEPLTTFPMYPSSFPLGLKRPWPPGLPPFNGMRDNGMGMSMNSSMMWNPNDVGDRALNYLNLQGMGVAPWMQPRLSMLTSQNDLYQQAMEAAVFQEMRNADPSKQALASLMQFQQLQGMANRQNSLISQQQQQQQQQPSFIPGFLDGITRLDPQTESFQKQLQTQNSFNNSQQQKLDDLQQLSAAMSGSSPSFQAQSSSMQQQQHQSFSSANMNLAMKPNASPMQNRGFGSVNQDGISHLVNVPRSTAFLSPNNGWPAKRIAIDPDVYSPIDRLSAINTSMSPNSVSLAPFPGNTRDCNINQGNNDAQNNTLFGVNIDPLSLLMNNGMQNVTGVGSHSDMTPITYGDSGIEHNSTFMASGCGDEPGLISSITNTERNNSPSGTFVKVYKTGSFGRSLDISKFSNYHELRGELAHMFGLEGLLEDPFRSGWQLVFVDRENDVLLLGDDPWPEFVNNVWCIKILSPQEVQQQMGNQGLELDHSRLSDNNSFDDYGSRPELRNPSFGITPVGSIHY